VSRVSNDQIRALHERLGKVFSQPVDVSSFTNKRLTVNFRVPLDRLRQLVPPSVEVEQIRDTGMGMISQCVCDFTVTKFGPVPIPKTHTNEMLCRISVKIKKDGQTYRAYYTLRSDSSSSLLSFLGGNFSHFRKDFTRAVEIMKIYSDAELDFVDCCLTAIAERLQITHILTFDRRDFTIIRPKHTQFFELLP